MIANKKQNEWKFVKSYATVENLQKALQKHKLENIRHLIVGIPATTRVTAIFQLSILQDKNIPILTPINAGFKVV